MFAQLDNICEEYLVKKAPGLPENIKELLVKIAPWVSLVGVILGIPAVLAIFGLSAFVMPLGFLGGIMSGRPFFGVTYLVSVAFLVVTLVLEALAIPGLFKRSKQGWMFAYYAVLVSAVSNLVSFNLGGLIIGTLIGLYILFQLKSYYR